MCFNTLIIHITLPTNPIVGIVFVAITGASVRLVYGHQTVDLAHVARLPPLRLGHLPVGPHIAFSARLHRLVAPTRRSLR